MRKILWLIGVVVVISMLGCGGGDDETTIKTDEGEVTVSQDQEKITFKGKTEEGDIGVEVGKGASLPKGFPDDITVYKGAEILTSAAKGDSEFMVTLKSSGDPESILSFYEKSLKDNGWEIGEITRLSYGNQQTITFEAISDDWQANIIINDAAEQGTMITIAIEKSE